jgi:hypothetical protein
MSPRARDAPSKKTTKKTALTTAATAAAEGKARKKRGARPTSSPPLAKRTRVVDVETGTVGTVIAAVPLRSAAPSAGGGGGAGGPLLVPLSLKEKDSDEESDVRIVSSVGEAPRGRSPHPSVTKPFATKAKLAQLPPAHQALHLKTLVSLPRLRQRVAKKIALLPKPKKRRRRRMRTPKAAPTV